MKGFKGILVLFALIFLLGFVSAEAQENSIMGLITGFMSGFSSNEIVEQISDSLPEELEEFGPGDDGVMTGPGDDGKMVKGPGDDGKMEQVSVSNPVDAVTQTIGNILSGIFGFFG